MLAFTLIMNTLAFSVESLFPVVAQDHLGVAAGLTGLLVAAPSIGTLVAAIGIGMLTGLRYHGRVFCLGLLFQLGSLVLFALSPWYPLSFILLLVAGIGAAGFSTMQSTIIMIAAAPAMRGTALGVLGQCIGSAAIGGICRWAYSRKRSTLGSRWESAPGWGCCCWYWSPRCRRWCTNPSRPPRKQTEQTEGTAAAKAG